MRRKISVFLKVIMVMLIIGISIFTTFIVREYKNTISESIINQRIDEIRNSEEYSKFDEINDTFLKGTVAVEDHRFYKHGAIDIVSIGRAFYENIKNGKIVQGGSTITQQLVKNLFLSNEQTLSRKIKEIVLAYKIEDMYSKDEILELYVNVIYYGDGYTGVLEASRGYFNKEPIDLTEDEATLLAGLPQAPSYYQLSNNMKEAEDRQKEVIAALNEFEGSME